MAYRATLDLGNAALLNRAAATRTGGLPAPPHTVAILRFALPRAEHAAVIVHDAQGQLTRTLLTGELPAGEHACGWDGRDEQHLPAPAGEYSLRLEVGSRLVTARRITVA